MRVFIANFGPENYLWATCLKRLTIATFESVDLLPFSLSGDRAGFVAHCIATKKSRHYPDAFRRIALVQGDPAHVSMPGVHRVASLLKRWVLGTHQGSVTPDHLQSYLEEFTFRFNRRTSRSRGLVFRRLLEQAVMTGPVTEDDVTGGYDW
jgi:hypothetical protein